MSEQSINKYFDLIKERPYDFIGDEIHIITDRNKLIQYEYENNCDLGLIYESPYHILVKDLVCSGNKIFVYERILKKNPNNAVVTIPVYNGKFVLIKQFRHALRDFQICFPRGFGEQEISVVENAKKELSEELGCEILSCDVLGKVIADSGICGDKVSICVCDISKPNIYLGYEGIKSIKLLSLNEIVELVDKNIINDGYTLSALNLYMAKYNHHIQ